MAELRAAGDTGWLIALPAGEGRDPALLRRVRDLKVRVDAARIPGVVESHGGYRSLLVTYDPTVANPKIVRAALERIAAAAPEPSAAGPSGRRHRFSLCACAECAPDRDAVAAHAKLPFAEFLRRYCAAPLEVWVTGFLPGFPYLGPLPPELAVPRLSHPRVRVAAGSVGIGGEQTGVYPLAAPGGWRLIGRTPAVLFDPARAEPALLKPGDRVVFEPVADHAAAFP